LRKAYFNFLFQIITERQRTFAINVWLCEPLASLITLLSIVLIILARFKVISCHPSFVENDFLVRPRLDERIGEKNTVSEFL
jgi:hypothetical protein